LKKQGTFFGSRIGPDKPPRRGRGMVDVPESNEFRTYLEEILGSSETERDSQGSAHAGHDDLKPE